MNDKQEKNTDKDKTELKRLPCRGCTVHCKHYNTCEGKLWRMDATHIKPEQD